jgi:hypothetical protein
MSSSSSLVRDALDVGDAATRLCWPVGVGGRRQQPGDEATAEETSDAGRSDMVGGHRYLRGSVSELDVDRCRTGNFPSGSERVPGR